MAFSVRDCPLCYLGCRPDCEPSLLSLASFETSSASISELIVAERSRRWLSKARLKGPETWDCNGGSLLLGVVMNVGNQRWPWFALLTKLGRERHAGKSLGNVGYECYLPVSCSTRRWSDRWKKVETPLFPGYLFCRMNLHDRLPVLTTPGVIQIVGVGKTPVPIEEDEIVALQRVESSRLPTIPWPYLEVGQIARIGDGPLKGLTGAVTRIKSGMKLILSVRLLQRSVAVEIDRDWIVNVEAPRSATNEPGCLTSIAGLIQPCGVLNR